MYSGPGEPIALWPANHYCLRCIGVGTVPIVAQTLERNRLGSGE